MLMPTLQSAELWRESGRYDDYGQEMLRIRYRHDRAIDDLVRKLGADVQPEEVPFEPERGTRDHAHDHDAHDDDRADYEYDLLQFNTPS